jgi:hypothetical protein
MLSTNNTSTDTNVSGLLIESSADWFATILTWLTVTNIAIIIQAIIAVAIILSARYAKKSIESFKQVEKLKFSMVALRKINNTENYLKVSGILSILEDNREELNGQTLADNYFREKKNQEQLEQAITVISYLNDLEDMAIGIEQNVYDESTIKKSIELRVIKTYKASEVFIKTCQTYTKENNLWGYFGKLAQKWEKEKNT